MFCSPDCKVLKTASSRWSERNVLNNLTGGFRASEIVTFRRKRRRLKSFHRRSTSLLGSTQLFSCLGIVGHPVVQTLSFDGTHRPVIFREMSENGDRFCVILYRFTKTNLIDMLIRVRLYF